MRRSVERPPTARYDGYRFYGTSNLTLEDIVFIRDIALVRNRPGESSQLIPTTENIPGNLQCGYGEAVLLCGGPEVVPMTTS